MDGLNGSLLSIHLHDLPINLVPSLPKSHIVSINDKMFTIDNVHIIKVLFMYAPMLGPLDRASLNSITFPEAVKHSYYN